MARPCPVRLYTIYDMAFYMNIFLYENFIRFESDTCGLCARFINNVYPVGVRSSAFWLSWIFGAARCAVHAGR